MMLAVALSGSNRAAASRLWQAGRRLGEATNIRTFVDDWLAAGKANPRVQTPEEPASSVTSLVLPDAPQYTLDEIVAFALELTDLNAPTRDRATQPGSDSDHLTQRETQILRLIADGKANREIAGTLSLSVRTVERHIANIYAKIGVHNRAEATAYVFRNHQVNRDAQRPT
jgi:DNA-binding CsgD family transcriptional regulator